MGGHRPADELVERRVPADFVGTTRDRMGRVVRAGDVALVSAKTAAAASWPTLEAPPETPAAVLPPEPDEVDDWAEFRGTVEEPEPTRATAPAPAPKRRRR